MDAIVSCPRAVGVRFDDPKLVSWVGLAPVMAMAQRCSLAMLLTDRLTIAAKGGANDAVKILALTAGMVCGADSIEAIRRAPAISGAEVGVEITANAARLVCAAIAHNLTRAANLLAGGRQTGPAAARRTQLINIPANRALRTPPGPAPAPRTGPGRTASTSSSAASCTPLPARRLTTRPKRPDRNTPGNNRTDRQLTHMEVACPAGWAPSLRRIRADGRDLRPSGAAYQQIKPGFSPRRASRCRGLPAVSAEVYGALLCIAPAHAWPRSRRSR